MSKDVVIEGESRSFPVPPALRATQQYTAEVEKVPSGKPGTWSTLHIKVLDNREVLEAGDDNDGSIIPRVVFEYDRNYSSMYNTFHPFRQLKDGKWHDYALISTKYVRFEVVDLEKGEIIAIEPAPFRTQESIDRIPEQHRAPGGYAEHYKVGEEIPGAGFCPTDFRVFDWNEKYYADSINKTMKDREGNEIYLYSLEDFNQVTGQWAVYCGCHWGDDSSYKLRYIDLSRISEGIVNSDSRFGYFPLGATLKDVSFFVDSGELIVPLEVTVNVETGKSYPEDVNWMTAEEADEY